MNNTREKDDEGSNIRDDSGEAERYSNKHIQGEPFTAMHYFDN